MAKENQPSFGDLVEKIGIEEVYPEQLQAEIKELENRICARYNIQAEHIPAQIRQGALPEDELIQRWIAARAMLD